VSTILPETALRDHVGIFGRTGSGKSYCAKGIVEKLLEGKRRVCVLDPTGAWSGLKWSASGKSVGYPVVIFGGERADMPLTRNMGAPLADIVAGGNVPCVVDLSDMATSERNQFAAEFAETLLRKNRAPLHLVIDEADEFMPLGAASEKNVALNTMLNRFDRIIRRGRRLGFRCILISQRPAVLHTSARSQCNTIIVLRLTSPHDRDAVAAWIRGQGDEDRAKEVLGSLSSLKRGEGWVWVTDDPDPRRVTFPRIKTFDSSATPDDGVVIEPKMLAAVDLSGIRSAMSEAVAEAEANDPKLLRAELAKLRAELNKGRTTDAGAIRTAIIEAEHEARRRARVGVANELEPRLTEAQRALGALRDAVAMLADSKAVVTSKDAVTAKGKARAEAWSDIRAARVSALRYEEVRQKEAVDEEVRQNAIANGEGPGGGGESRILAAIAMRHAPTRRETLTVLTGYKRSSRDTYLQRLRAKGLIEESAGRFTCTALGRSATCNVAPLPTGRDLRDFWLRRLPAGEGKVLRVLLDAWPNKVSRETLTDATGYKRSSRDTYLQRLAARELVEFKDGAPCAAGEMFEE